MPEQVIGFGRCVDQSTTLGKNCGARIHVPFLPKEAADSCVRRANRFIKLAKVTTVLKVKNDLRRMAIVMAVAAVDSYMHGIVLVRIADVRRQVDLPKSWGQLDIPFSEVADLADAIITAQRGGRNMRPWVKVKASLQRRLLRDTFQSYDQVGKAFALAGIDKAWSRVATELGEGAEAIKMRLNALVYRRNQIAHEGDLKRASRPRKLAFNQIDHKRVVDEVKWVSTLIDAMDKVVSNP